MKLEIFDTIEPTDYESPNFIDDFEEISQPPKQPNATTQQVATWMKEQMGNDDYLHQQTIAYGIAVEFDDKFTYTNENGNRAIATEVLEEFRKITPNLVWSRSGFYWRKRLSSDDSNKRQVE